MVIILDGNLDGKKARAHNEQSLLFDLFKTSRAVKNTHIFYWKDLFFFMRGQNILS